MQVLRRCLLKKIATLDDIHLIGLTQTVDTSYTLRLKNVFFEEKSTIEKKERKKKVTINGFKLRARHY